MTLMSRLAAERSNCWPLVSTIRTGIVGVKSIAANLAQHAVPAGKMCRHLDYTNSTSETGRTTYVRLVWLPRLPVTESQTSCAKGARFGLLGCVSGCGSPCRRSSSGSFLCCGCGSGPAAHCRPQTHRQPRQLVRLQTGLPLQALPWARRLRPAEQCGGSHAGLLWRELPSTHDTLLASTPDTIALWQIFVWPDLASQYQGRCTGVSKSARIEQVRMQPQANACMDLSV